MITQVFEKQQQLFASGITLNIAYRKQQLRELRRLIKLHEKELSEALFLDLKKSTFEAYATEIGIVLEEITRHLRKINCWARPKSVSTPLTALPARSYSQAEPYGVSLIIAPSNYAVQLGLAPLVGAISAGNTAIIKPSELSGHTAAILEKIINENFDPDYLKVVNGDASISQQLLKLPVDFIFFTGSPRIGKIVMKAASEHLTPLVLELGGKSPCIVDQHVNIAQTARRIIWGKCINAGQTCIAPDYLMVHQSIKNSLVEELKLAIKSFFGDNPQTSPDYPRIINKPNFLRLQVMLGEGKLLAGGQTDESDLYIAPSLVEVENLTSVIMGEEIFGPVLPIITFNDAEEVIRFVRKKPKPLALYLFSNNKNFRNLILSRISSGGVTINDTLMHFTNARLPFGGVGYSGMGSYHGESSFRAFSHNKPILKRATWIDVPVRYAPYKGKLQLIKWLIK